MSGMLMRTFATVGLLLMAAGLLSAADVTGTWKGSFDFNGASVPLTFDMKSADGVVTGIVDGLPSPKVEIKDGKIDGDTVTFWIGIEYQGNPVKLLLKGKVSGEQIDFSMGTEGGEWGVQLTAKKSS
jgi:hypothetical protein